MDTTETYIKMRLAAIPDLGMGIPMGFSINWQSEAILIDEKGDWYYSTKDEACQLERQDQLQEMVKNSFDFACDDFELVELFYNFVWLDDPQWDKLGILSMEQLWLAFVQKELHNKVWIGDYWEVEVS